MNTSSTTNAPHPVTGASQGSEASQTGGSSTSREDVATHGTPDSTYSTNATDPEVDVESVRDASTDGNQAEEVEGVRSGTG
ncbi:MAG: hypothetical protein JO316_06095 [Abitibacteriaceae bacterium]|nr:hypothetical protein [Abditibacteriaceae bacterium]MBV9864901.1 hypothetical protein [Abditibacteriaceae bacterium]